MHFTGSCSGSPPSSSFMREPGVCRVRGPCPLLLDHALGNQAPRSPCKMVWACFKGTHGPPSHVHLLPRPEGNQMEALLGQEGALLCCLWHTDTYSSFGCGRSWKWEVNWELGCGLWAWASHMHLWRIPKFSNFLLLLEIYLSRKEARTWLVY